MENYHRQTIDEAITDSHRTFVVESTPVDKTIAKELKVKQWVDPKIWINHLVGAPLATPLEISRCEGKSVIRYINTNDISDDDGVVKTGELAYIIGLDWFGLSDTLLSTQLFPKNCCGYTILTSMMVWHALESPVN